MLANPDYDHLKLLAIALEVGFNNKTSFNRVFKGKTGKTPSEYRKMMLNPSQRQLFTILTNGQIEKNKDENVIISELEHRTTSSVFKKGQWEVKGGYLFKRSEEAEQYKTLKYH